MSEIYIHAHVEVVEGKSEEFLVALATLAKQLSKTLDVQLVDSYRVDGQTDSFVNVWRIPNDDALQELSSNGDAIRGAIGKLIKSEKAMVVRPTNTLPTSVPPADPPPDSDYNLVLADHDGTIYSLPYESWKKEEYRTDLPPMDASVLHRNTGEDPGWAFVCWYVNLKLLNDGLRPRSD